jgi:pentatricopeptide repeat protein
VNSAGMSMCFAITLLCHACAFPKVVLKLLVDVLKKGIGPDVFSFTIAVRSLCGAGKLRVAKCVMENEGIGYDAVAFNTLIHGFFMAGDIQSARLTYNCMISRNVLPNEFSKSMVIDSYCKEQNFGAAANFFLEYSGDPHVHDHFVRLNNWLVVKARQLSYVRYLLDEVWSRGFALDVCIFDSLVRIFCFEGYCEHEIEIVSCMLRKSS